MSGEVSSLNVASAAAIACYLLGPGKLTGPRRAEPGRRGARGALVVAVAGDLAAAWPPGRAAA